MANELAKKVDYGTQVIKRVDGLCAGGFTMPADYNHVNAIKASMLVLSDMVDKQSGKPVLEVCTPASIQTALFDMVTKGLDVSKGQGYFSKRGTKLKFMDEVYGNVLQVKRVFPDFEPRPRVVYAGDDFAYETDIATGKRKLTKHVQKLENIDGGFDGFVGAYMYVPSKTGESDLYVMTRKQILAAWSNSGDKNLTTHKQFPDKMVSKTIINSACQMIINSTPECATFMRTAKNEDTEFAEAEEMSAEEAVVVDELPEADTEEVVAEEVPSDKPSEGGADAGANGGADF